VLEKLAHIRRKQHLTESLVVPSYSVPSEEP